MSSCQWNVPFHFEDGSIRAMSCHGISILNHGYANYSTILNPQSTYDGRTIRIQHDPITWVRRILLPGIMKLQTEDTLLDRITLSGSIYLN